MALTKTDLEAIRSVVKDEVSIQIETQVRSIVREEVKSEVSNQLQPVIKALDKHSEILEKHSNKFKYLRKTANLILGYVEEKNFDLTKRVDRIEEHLNLPPIS